MKIVTFSAIKGGTGKTSSALAIAQAGKQSGKRVLAIDLDPQSNLSFCLGASGNTPGTFELLKGAPVAETIQATPQGIDCIVGSFDLVTLTTSPGSGLRLAKALEPIKKKYDLIVIDTPPSPGELQLNALYASTALVIPLQTDIPSLRAFIQIVSIAEQAKQTNPGLKIKGYVLSQYNERIRVNSHIAGLIAAEAKKHRIPCLGTVRSGIAIREAQGFRQSLYEYAPKSNPALDYLSIYEKI